MDKREGSFMMYVSVIIFLLMILLNSFFKIASFFRLGLPLLYVFAVPILFPSWLHEHETLATSILFVMLGFVVLSWVLTIRKKIRLKQGQKQNAQG